MEIYIMRLNSVRVVEVSGLSDQIRKPVNLNVNNQTYDIIDEIVGASNGSRAFQENIIAEALGSAVSNSEAELVDIVNGWGESRFRVIIEIEEAEINNYGPGERTFLTGYTDRIEYTDGSGELPDDMVIYINGFINVMDQYREDRNGDRYIHSVVRANNQLILGKYNPRSRRSGDTDYMCRPSEVFVMVSCMDSNGDFDEDTNIIDIQFNRGTNASARRNNMNGRYLSHLILSDQTGRDQADMWGSSSVAGSYRTEQARSFSADDLINSNGVLNRLLNETDIMTERNITYGQLTAFTKRDDIKDVWDATQIFYRDNSEDFNPGSDTLDAAYRENQIGYTLSHSVPAAMIDCKLDSVKIIANNTHDLQGRWEIDIYDAQNSIGVDDRQFEDLFRNVFEREILPSVTNNNRDLLDLTGSVDVHGYCSWEISYNDGPFEEIVMTCFADSNTVQVITSDRRNVERVGRDYFSFSEEVDAIIDSHTGRNAREERRDCRDRDSDRDSSFDY